MTLSNSRINTFLACPKQFYFKYIEQEQDFAGESAIIGKKTHELIEHLTTEKMEEPDSKIDSALSFIHNPKEKEELKSLLTNWEDWQEENKDFNILGIEYEFGLDKNFNIRDFGDPSAIFRGIIDQVCFDSYHNILKIVDFKTGYGKPSFKQLELYAIFCSQLIKDIFSKGFLKGEYVYLRSGLTQVQEISQFDISKAKEELIAIRDSILRTKDFEGTPGTHCSYCSYKLKCDIGMQMDSLTNGKSIKDIAKEYIVLTAKVEEMRKILKDYCSNGSKIELENGTVEIKQSKRTEVSNIPKLKEILETRGYDISQYITESVNTQKLKGKKIQKDIPELAWLLVESPYANLLTVSNKEDK